jgi:hypothetical protein
MREFKTTWLGDGDPSLLIIYMGDLRFIVNEMQTVPEDHPFGEMIFNNHFFENEPEEIAETAIDPNADEKAMVKAELDAAGITYDGRSNLATLQALLPQG